MKQRKRSNIGANTQAVYDATNVVAVQCKHSPWRK